MDKYETGQVASENCNNRPYRSHLQPACFECRKCKSRCATNGGSSACVLCQLRGLDCNFPRPTHSAADTKSSMQGVGRKTSIRGRSQKRAKQQMTSTTTTHIQNEQQTLPALPYITRVEPNTTQQELDDTIGLLDEAQDESPHVAGPALVDDVNDLEENHNSGIVQGKRFTYPFSRSSTRHRNMRPVLFTTVRRRPVGSANTQSCASSKCEIIEKLIGPHALELIKV